MAHYRENLPSHCHCLMQSMQGYESEIQLYYTERFIPGGMT